MVRTDHSAGSVHGKSGHRTRSSRPDANGACNAIGLHLHLPHPLRHGGLAHVHRMRRLGEAAGCMFKDAVGVTWLYYFDFEIKVIAKLPDAIAA